MLETTDSVEIEIEMNAFGPTDFVIAAGDPAATATASYRNRQPNDRLILGAFPHMHLLGTHFNASITRAETGDELCLLDGAYDFDHQLTYMFEDPVTMTQGDELDFTCTWDNSSDNPNQFADPPGDVVFGESTSQEMCFCSTRSPFTRHCPIWATAFDSRRTSGTAE